MELKDKGNFVTASIVKIFQNPSFPILEKIDDNYNKKYFLAIMKHFKDLWGTKVMYCYIENHQLHLILVIYTNIQVKQEIL